MSQTELTIIIGLISIFVVIVIGAISIYYMKKTNDGTEKLINELKRVVDEIQITNKNAGSIFHAIENLIIELYKKEIKRLLLIVKTKSYGSTKYPDVICSDRVRRRLRRSMQDIDISLLRNDYKEAYQNLDKYLEALEKFHNMSGSDEAKVKEAKEKVKPAYDLLQIVHRVISPDDNWS